VKVAFDSRAVSDPDGVGRYSRCLLAALRDTAGSEDEIVEADRPSLLARSRSADVFHSPWMDGAMLHSPCPMVVTIHDLAALKRRSEHLRGGGMHLRLRNLAVQRATHVIVPTALVAGEAIAALGFERERVIVIPHASQPTVPTQTTWTWEDVASETWAAYRRALAQPHRPCVTGFKRPRLSKPRVA
jgi:Glycosyltransferase Family 4